MSIAKCLRKIQSVLPSWRWSTRLWMWLQVSWRPERVWRLRDFAPQLISWKNRTQRYKQSQSSIFQSWNSEISNNVHLEMAIHVFKNCLLNDFKYKLQVFLSLHIVFTDKTYSNQVNLKNILKTCMWKIKFLPIIRTVIVPSETMLKRLKEQCGLIWPVCVYLLDNKIQRYIPIWIMKFSH